MHMTSAHEHEQRGNAAMQRSLARLTLALGTAALSGAVLAHPGHDHAHWSSSAMHAALLMSMFALAATGVWLALRRQKQRARRPAGSGERD
jgi:hypothetical protein